ncbi:MAG: glycosyltransferase [Candidatus Thorarchaeota archaeon]
MAIEISIVIPVYNEERNIRILYEEIKGVMKPTNKKYEVLFVDDGSKDHTPNILEKLKNENKDIKIITFRRNFGQTAAIDAGFKNSSGKIIITMDGDLQNDPSDIPRLIKKLEEGYDCISGWRYKRRDSFSKRFMSRGADFLRKLIFKDTIHDSGCTLKAYRKKALENLELYGEAHRFIPAILSIRGYRIGEIKVRHRKRKYGKTKYNLKRTVKGLLDMILIKFWMDFSTRPIHLLGGMGLLSFGIGSLITLYLVIIKLFFSQAIGDRPLLIFGVLFIIVGIIFIMFGILADILIKIYYQKEKYYSIKNEIKN